MATAAQDKKPPTQQENKMDDADLQNHMKVTLLSDMFQNPLLTDMDLCNPHTHGKKRVHQAILAFGSKYFLEVFHSYQTALSTNPDKWKELHNDINGVRPYIEVPRPPSTLQNPTNEVSDENVNRILKYIYNNQDFAVIRPEISELNVQSFYAQAQVMKCTKLIADLDNLIITELLKPTNCTQFYLESIRVSILQLHSLTLFCSSRTKRSPKPASS